MLHVTNGDAAAEKLRATGLPGEILPWRDVLHEGPVPARLPLEELSGVRARFIAGREWGAREEVERSFRERDRALADFRAHEEVVLWFEHDLYDQLQLAQLLDWFSDQDPGSTALTLVCGAEYLGNSAPERLAERFASRSLVGEAELALGEDAWNAFRSPDPTAIEPLLAGDGGALPFLAPALRRHLEQFPSVRNGLSRSEQQALEAIADGAATVREAYLASHPRREEPIWLGDLTFVSYLEELSRDDTPLVMIDGGTQGVSEADFSALLDHRVSITDAGREVMEGRADRVRMNGIDRWLGGVHLRGRVVPWRWDAAAGHIVRAGGD